MKSLLNKWFKLEENNTTITTEIVAGLTTFFAMCYIVIVNPNQMTGFFNYLSDDLQIMWNASFIGGLIAAIIGTLLSGILGKKPFAQAAGMGLNSFFFVSFISIIIKENEDKTYEVTGNILNNYGAGLACILISGLIFLILSITGLRSYIAKAFPDCLKKSIPAGIGLFIAFIGMKNSCIIVDNPYTFVGLADFTQWVEINKYGGIIGGAAPALCAFIGLIVIIVLTKLNIKVISKGAVIIGIAVSTGLYYAFGLGQYNSIVSTSIGDTFRDFAQHGLFNIHFDLAFDGHTLGSIFTVIMTIITFSLVDMFDTMGTLYGTAAQADLLDENGDPQNMGQLMLADSIATVTGACLGSSTITTFVESAAGVGAGGRTGLTSIVTAICFAFCLFLAPIAQYIPSIATAPALIYVGILMIKSFIGIDFNDLTAAAVGFITLITMILTYSISNGIGIGAITYVLITLLTGKYKKDDIVVTAIAILFALRFAFVTM